MHIHVGTDPAFNVVWVVFHTTLHIFVGCFWEYACHATCSCWDLPNLTSY